MFKVSDKYNDFIPFYENFKALSFQLYVFLEHLLYIFTQTKPMKLYLIDISLVLLLSIFPSLNAQSIYVEEWAQAPDSNELNKPLVVLDFWATWCGPCIQAMPQTERAVSQFDDDVLLMYLSNEPSLTVNKFMEKKGLHFISAVDTQARSSDYFEISNLPSTLILNSDGDKIWDGHPTEVTPELLSRLVRKHKGTSVNTARFYIDSPKEEVKEIHFDTYQAKGISIDFTTSNSASYFMEDLKPEFYFNGDLPSLVAYIYDLPAKNVMNESVNGDFYTLQCTYEDREKFKKALEKFIKKELHIDLVKDAKMQNTFVLSAKENPNFLDTNTYDFSENKAKFLASDMDIEIDNASVGEMVQILNKFSEHHFETEGFDSRPFDWNIHFKFNELTLEQLAHDYLFDISEEERLVSTILIKDQ